MTDLELDSRSPQNPCGPQQESILSVIAEVLGVNANALEGRACLVEDFGADSLDLIELELVLEAKFQARISGRLIERLTTVDEIVRLVTTAFVQDRTPLFSVRPPVGGSGRHRSGVAVRHGT